MLQLTFNLIPLGNPRSTPAAKSGEVKIAFHLLILLVKLLLQDVKFDQ